MGGSWIPRVFQRTVAVRRGMARAGRGAALPARSRNHFALRRRSAARPHGSVHGSRPGLAFLAALLIAGPAEAQVTSSRIWPAPDYTRLTLESKSAIKHSLFTLKDPERLVMDLETDELPPALEELAAKVAAEDPYIKGLRVARNRPGVVRVVLDLKADVKPQLFTLPPIAEYGHRLVLDIHPAVPVDPLAALIEQTQNGIPSKEATRLATIVIDAGHGGEDPGALGRHGS